MQFKCTSISWKIGALFLLAATNVVCGLSARATLYSSNAGTIPSTGIQYTVTLEDDVTSRMALRFRLKNNSSKPYYIARSAFDVPGNLAVFFSTDETPLVSSTGEWASDINSSGSVMGSLEIRPGQTVEEIFPIGFYYDKIYKKRRDSNIYIYWGVTMPNSTDDALIAERENRPVRELVNEILPRIGGMLTLPKKTED